jgi:hypothetical protein
VRPLLPDSPKLWKATTAREFQYRFHSGLLEQRDILISAGVNADNLPIPNWLVSK